MTDEEKRKLEEQQAGYTPKGVDQTLLDKTNTSFTPSGVNEQEKSNALKNFTDIASQSNIVSDKTWDTINSTFQKPTAVAQADSYLKGALSKIQSGKTSYSDKVRDMISQIQGRDKFSYDVDKDPLFQQALASAMKSGQSAMQDTIGQASALTGGYGSSYATSAANQAYNSFIEDAYSNLPQYYQMAMDAYQMEGDEMYRQLDMLSSADEREYARLINGYDATSSYRNNMYNEAYQQFRDTKSDAISGANLALSEYGQQVSNAFNLYNAYAKEAETAYNREYQAWLDEIKNTWQMIDFKNSNAWKQTELDFENEWKQKQLDFENLWKQKAFDEEQRQFDEKLRADLEQFNKEMGYKWANFNEGVRQFNYDIGDTNNDGVVSDEERAAFEVASKKPIEESGIAKLSSTELNAAIKANQSAGGGHAGMQAAVDTLVMLGVDPFPFLSELADALEANYTPDKPAFNNIGQTHNFNRKDGKEFQVTLKTSSGYEGFTVKNKGKVEDDVKKELDKYDVSDGSAFVYNGDIYVKDGGAYYLIGKSSSVGKHYDELFNLLK